MDREPPVVVGEQDLIKDIATALAKKTRDEIKLILRKRNAAMKNMNYLQDLKKNADPNVPPRKIVSEQQ